MGRLHDALKQSGYEGHDLERLLVRLVFCLFADATGIFEPRGIFLDLIEQHSRIDGSGTGPLLNQFSTFSTPPRRVDKVRSTTTCRVSIHQRRSVRSTASDRCLRRPNAGHLLEACEFSWDAAFACDIRLSFPVGHECEGEARVTGTLHNRKENYEGHPAPVSG